MADKMNRNSKSNSARVDFSSDILLDSFEIAFSEKSAPSASKSVPGPFLREFLNSSSSSRSSSLQLLDSDLS